MTPLSGGQSQHEVQSQPLAVSVDLEDKNLLLHGHQQQQDDIKLDNKHYDFTFVKTSLQILWYRLHNPLR